MLEVGSGAGHLALRLAERADHVDAVEIDPLMVKATQAIVPANVSCRRGDVMADDMPPGSYDAIVSLSVLHHLDLQPALTRFADALRPGGSWSPLRCHGSTYRGNYWLNSVPHSSITRSG